MLYVSRTRHRVRSYELDAYGHVNNAVYMQWLEHGRSRLLQDKGFDYNNIEERWGVRFVTASTKIDFHIGLHLDDDLEFTTTIARIGTTSVTLDQRIGRGDEVAASCQTVIVFTDPSMTAAVPIPEEFKELYA
ncbi:MAG: acyl-CoA thioesterase [Planctomycetes bacterium]|jgi:YbgC/YbaW family acyl-CoA thioester hydrolase|nr:acyl-CoA thioesterase [Planctomycetota bacterium]